MAVILGYEGIEPAVATPTGALADDSAVLGRVTLGRGATLCQLAVIRADGHVVEIGDDFFLGARATVHIAHGRIGTFVGRQVAVGSDAVVHACSVGDDCVIGPGAAVLDGAVVEPGCVIAAGSVVFPGTRLPAGHWCEGSPAQPLRPVSDHERAQARQQVREGDPGWDSPRLAVEATGRPAGLACAPDAYVARTARVAAPLRMEAGSSLWFGCVVQSSGPAVILGEGANVQDNSVLSAHARELHIGRDSTIGHNVVMQDCSVGARSLVGMASRLAAGTQVDDDCFVAAGTWTQPGQRLTAGGLWGGRPARRLADLSDRLRQVIAGSAEVYRRYAAEFTVRQAQATDGANLSPRGQP